MPVNNSNSLNNMSDYKKRTFIYAIIINSMLTMYSIPPGSQIYMPFSTCIVVEFQCDLLQAMITGVN